MVNGRESFSRFRFQKKTGKHWGRWKRFSISIFNCFYWNNILDSMGVRVRWPLTLHFQIYNQKLIFNIYIYRAEFIIIRWNALRFFVVASFLWWKAWNILFLIIVKSIPAWCKYNPCESLVLASYPLILSLVVWGSSHSIVAKMKRGRRYK